MKVKIGPYQTYFGPYQLAELLCFWVKETPDKYGFKQKPEWVDTFGEWLAHGSVEPEDEVGDCKKFFNNDRPITWIYKLLLWIDKLKGKRTIKVHIDKYDTWNMNSTLALIIVPMLKQLKATTHGAPYIDDEDVPEELKSTSAPPKETEWDTDENHFKRWDWVLDQMIWSFENLVNDDWENQFHTGEHDTYTKKQENGTYLMVRGEKDTSHFDADGYKAYSDRITNGTRLFGKYYRSLWD